MDLVYISSQYQYRVQCARGFSKKGVARQPLHVARSSPATTTAKLTKDDLVAYLASGCKPREAWRYASIGPCYVKRPGDSFVLAQELYASTSCVSL